MDNGAYPLRDTETVSKMQADYSAKLQRNKESGQEAFATLGLRQYKGVPREIMERPCFFTFVELS
ncbi:MAG: hypothetical protein AAB583_02505 [Patescibacteria group bacterium]